MALGMRSRAIERFSNPSEKCSKGIERFSNPSEKCSKGSERFSNPSEKCSMGIERFSNPCEVLQGHRALLKPPRRSAPRAPSASPTLGEVLQEAPAALLQPSEKCSKGIERFSNPSEK